MGLVKLTVLDSPTLVTIKILDSGCGIPTKHLKRVFEPFLLQSPKGEAKWAFLWLTAIEQHQGKISISSKEAKGTVVRSPFRNGQHSPRPVKIMKRIKKTKRKTLKRPRKQIAQYRVDVVNPLFVYALTELTSKLFTSALNVYTPLLFNVTK